jgi:hypothetical protein
MPRDRALPTVADALIFIEVPSARYAQTRHYRIPLFVKAGVTSWIVNVSSHQVETYGSAADLERPHGNVFTAHDVVEFLGITIPVAFLFDVTARP